jgi:serine phosphatase RsbU (regulator of sigma subunit)
VGIDYGAVFAAAPSPYLVLDLNFVIVAANAAYCATSGRARDDLIGRIVFEVFPDNPDGPVDGVAQLRSSLERTRDSGRPHAMSLLRYDVEDPASGGYVARYWSTINTPVPDEHGHTVLLLHRPEEVTDYIQKRHRDDHASGGSLNEQQLQRAALAEADAFARVQELQIAWKAEAIASDRLAALAESLQRSLLTEPPQTDQLQIVVRYRPAMHEAQVGGDWYDAFLTTDGATCIVIGDVAGHDRTATAAMGELRNVLRGITYIVAQPPAAILTAVDHAIRDLALGTIATAVLARVEQTPADAQAGLRRLRWSNAGHPPPLLINPDATVRLLHTEPALLLGVDPAHTRVDHEQLLHPGATVLLYTDGLVERRGADLDDGLSWLVAAVTRLARQPLDLLCDTLLDQIPQHSDDDIALIALRAHPEA